MYQVREANIADVLDIYNIWADGWRYAYKNILSAEFLERCCGSSAIIAIPKQHRPDGRCFNFWLCLPNNFRTVTQFCKGGASK